MKNYNSNDTDQSSKDPPPSLIKSKFDYELFDEEAASVISKCISVKRIALPNKGEKWKIFENSKQIFVLEGTKLGKKEKDFLSTIEGVNLLIKSGKEGIKNFTALHKKIKDAIKCNAAGH
jgi:hypothetical protein